MDNKDKIKLLDMIKQGKKKYFKLIIYTLIIGTIILSKKEKKK